MAIKTTLEDKRRLLSRSEAEGVALKLFQAIASDEDHLDRFLALTGLTPQSIREAANSPGFLPSILDYVCGNESDLMKLADRTALKPEDISAAHHALAPRDSFD